MNLYNLHSDPESIKWHKEAQEQVPELVYDEVDTFIRE